MFVNFTGKKELFVQRTDLNFYEMTPNDWEEIFPEFVNQISESTGYEITQILKPDFTTTTPVSLAVGQLTIMSTMKHYFIYKAKVSGCGLLYITIEGTIEDWTKILHKLDNLKKYDFEWFTENVIEIITKITQTLNGEIDTKFWKNMIRIKDGNDNYDPSTVDGWFTCLFPFLKNRSIRTDPIRVDQELQPEVQKIPLSLEIVNEGIFNCEIIADFVGLTQNNESYADLLYEYGDEECLKEAAYYYKMSADKGNDLAMLKYAYMLHDGHGIEQNKKEAACYLKISADKGNIIAMYSYAEMLRNGDGIIIDKKEAAKYYKKSADKGLEESMINYSVMLLNNDGIKRNSKEAAHYLKIAADKRNIL